MKIILMASNNGHLLDELKDDVVLVLSDKPHAPVLERAEKLGIPSQIINNNIQLAYLLDAEEFDCIMMCGYLQILPKTVTDEYEIFNTHPSLLPKYDGMFGRNIHEAVLENGDIETGVTLHRVNEIVDGGEIVLQKTVEVLQDDTVDTLEKRIKDTEKVIVTKFFERASKHFDK